MDRKAYIRVKTGEGMYDLIYPITTGDNIELVDEKGNLTQKLRNIDDTLEGKVSLSKLGVAEGIATLDANGFIPLVQMPLESKEMRVVENIEQLNAIENKFTSLSVFVKDATGDPTVKSGGAFYIYDGNKFIKTAQSDTMNVVVDFANVTNKPTTLEGYGITDAIHESEKTRISNPKNAGKILVLNKDGELDVNVTGRSNSTSRLDTPRLISFSGDLTGEFLFDGGNNVDVFVQLLSKGIKPGTYSRITVDERGQIIAVSKLLPSDIPNVDWSKIVGRPDTLKDFGITDEVMVRNKEQRMSAKLYLSGDPTDDLGAVTKRYVDTLSLTEGLNVKKSVTTVTEENITLSGLLNISDVQLKSGDRILVQAQNNKTENGIYVVKEDAWIRADDLAANKDFVKGTYVFVENGKYSGRGFSLIYSNPIVVGESNIEFTQFSSASDILTGSGLTREGNLLALESFGTPGTYAKVTIDKHGRVISAKKTITEADISGGINWNKLVEAPASAVEDIDMAVTSRHIHRNKDVVDKLSQDEEGNLLYDGKEIAVGGSGNGGSINGTLTSVGSYANRDLAVGGIWFNTNPPDEL